MTTDRYTQQPVAGAGYFGLFDGDHELSDQDAIARLNAQAREINDLRAQFDTARLAPPPLADALDCMNAQAGMIAELRADLDTAFRYIRALLKYLPPTSINKEKHATITAARAWLRRGE